MPQHLGLSSHSTRQYTAIRLWLMLLNIWERWLKVADTLEQADVIVVLAGGNGMREDHAASLYQQGYAPIIVISEAMAEVAGHTIDLARLASWNLKQHGVPRAAIWRMAGRVKSTRDEATRFAELARSQHWNKVILVSDAYHSRRVVRTFRRSLVTERPRTIRVMMAPCERVLAAHNRMSIEKIVFNLGMETMKALYYHCRGW